MEFNAFKKKERATDFYQVRSPFAVYNNSIYPNPHFVNRILKLLSKQTFFLLFTQTHMIYFTKLSFLQKTLLTFSAVRVNMFLEQGRSLQVDYACMDVLFLF